MISAREDVYNALFALLSETDGFASYWQNYPPVDQLKTAEKPALLMRQVSEVLTSNYGSPPKYTITVELCVVVQAALSRGETPAPIINPLIDAIEAALAPDFTGTQRLGNRNVSRCWIEGEIKYFEAINDDLSYVYVPVNIVAV